MDILQELLKTLEQYYLQFIRNLPNIGLALFVVIISFWVGNKLMNLTNKRLGKRLKDELMISFIGKLAKTIIVIVGFLVVLKILGWGDAAASILATAGITAFIIGFAFKDIGENFLAGMMMAFKRPFRVGDTVRTGNIVGTVTNMSMRDTTLKTADGMDVFVPNSQLLKDPLFNYTLDGFLRYDFDIALDLDTNFHEVSKLIIQELNSVEGIMKENKTPIVHLNSIGTDKATLTIYYWIKLKHPIYPPGEIKTMAINRCIKTLIEHGYYKNYSPEIMSSKREKKVPSTAV